MTTPKALIALEKTKEAINDIKAKLEQVVQRLRDDAFDKATAQAQATVSLSIGMMKYMGARLQGLDHGRKQDDALRQELNQMRKVLAEIKARNGSTKKSSTRQATNTAESGSLEQPSRQTKAGVPKDSLSKKTTRKAPIKAEPLVPAVAKTTSPSSLKRTLNKSKNESKKKRRSR